MSDAFQDMQERAIRQMKELHASAAPAPNQPPPLPPCAAPRQQKGLFSRFFNMENDTALLLPLLLLLGREGADEGLLLALLYIML